MLYVDLSYFIYFFIPAFFFIVQWFDSDSSKATNRKILVSTNIGYV